jgi:hypothetical protein
MDPVTITAIIKIAEMGLSAYMSFMRQAGLNDEQIETVFQNAKKRLLLEDPSLIPDK